VFQYLLFFECTITIIVYNHLLFKYCDKTNKGILDVEVYPELIICIRSGTLNWSKTNLMLLPFLYTHVYCTSSPSYPTPSIKQLASLQSITWPLKHVHCWSVASHSFIHSFIRSLIHYSAAPRRRPMRSVNAGPTSQKSLFRVSKTDEALPSQHHSSTIQINCVTKKTKLAI